MSQLNKFFSDVNPDFSLNRKSEVLLGEEAINAEISNVLGISIGEYWWEPLFGSRLHSYIFEPLDEITAGKIYVEIVSIIPKWIPYIRLTSNSFVYANINNSSFDIYIEYSIYNHSQIASFSASLKR